MFVVFAHIEFVGCIHLLQHEFYAFLAFLFDICIFLFDSLHTLNEHLRNTGKLPTMQGVNLKRNYYAPVGARCSKTMPKVLAAT